MATNKRVMFVFGTRPEAIKMAPLIIEMEKHKDILSPIIVSTGQHREMLAQVLRIFNIKPDYDLSIMQNAQTLSQIVSKTLTGLENIILREKPDMLLVQGDTSTAFTAGLCAFYNKVKVGHVEAGLRTGDKMRPYPEEANRRLLSVIADLHFAPTQTSVSHLLAEGIQKQTVYCTGNTVIDALLAVAKRKFDISKLGFELDPNKKTILVTAHRRESFGPPMRGIFQAIRRLAEKHENEIDIVLPVHKNPAVNITAKEILNDVKNIKLIESLDYEPFVHLMKESYFILTDSGGVQEEAPSLGKPVLVLREKTERPEAIEAGTVKLIGVSEETVFAESEMLLCDKAVYKSMQKSVNPYGDGHASERIISAILHDFGFIDERNKEFSYQ